MQQTPEVILYFVGGLLDGDMLFSNVQVAPEERVKALRYYAESQRGTEGRRFTVSTGDATETYEVVRRFTVGNVVFVRSSSLSETSLPEAEEVDRAHGNGHVRQTERRKRRVLDRDVALLCANMMSFRLNPLRSLRVAESSRGE